MRQLETWVDRVKYVWFVALEKPQYLMDLCRSL